MASITMNFSKQGITLDFDDPMSISPRQLAQANALVIRRIKAARMEAVRALRAEEAAAKREAEAPNLDDILATAEAVEETVDDIFDDLEPGEVGT